MRTAVFGAILLVSLAAPPYLAAQGGDGSLRGTVKDEQGGAIPGVTVTATSPALIAPAVAVSESDGTYRLVNLPPGTYTVQAELQGFTTFRREGVLLRAAANFQVDVTMGLGAVQETITVTGDSPMLEVSRPSNVLNIDADFQKQVPVVEGKYWSDFLMMAPGVDLAAPQRRQRPAELLRQRRRASRRRDADGRAVRGQLQRLQHQPHGPQLGSHRGHRDQDRRRRCRVSDGLRAGHQHDQQERRQPVPRHRQQPVSSPSSGTPTTSARELPPRGRSGSTTSHSAAQSSVTGHGSSRRCGSPTTRAAPAARRSSSPSTAPSFRTARWGTTRFAASSRGSRSPRRSAANHDLSFVYQADRLLLKVVGAEDYEPVEVLSTGGPMYGAKLTSVWGQNVTSTFSASYNRKGGNSLDSYKGRNFTGPLAEYHREAFLNQGILQGSGLLVRGGQWSSTACDACYDLDTSSILMLRGDVTWYTRGWAGTHDVQTGFLALPQNNFDKNIQYLNDGFIFEERRQINPQRPVGWHPAVPPAVRHRQPQSAHRVRTRSRHRRLRAGHVEADLALDGDGRAARRLRAPLRRAARSRPAEQHRDRAALRLLLPADRGCEERASRQLRPHPPAVDGDAASGRGVRRRRCGGPARRVRRQRRRRVRDGHRDARRRAATISTQQFDPELHQPLFDEFTLGFRRQFPGQTSVDVAGIVKINKEQYAQVDINGIYPAGPNQPFGGFGLVDPNSGLLYRVTNNTWSQMDYRALQITIAKNLTQRLPVPRDHSPPVAAPDGHVESDRPGALHPAGRVPEQPAPVAHRRRCRIRTASRPATR